MPQVDIILRTIDNTTAPTKKVVGSFTELNSAIALASKGMEVAKKVYAETVGETLKYANSVRQLSSISGQSTEVTSKFIQVIDDYKLSADDALAATKALTKNGHAPSIETLAQLSDQYLKINDVEDKNAFILKNLGKGGLQWVEVLEQGSRALLEQGSAVNKNLILSEKAVKQAREYELALDDWNDSVLGLKVSIGQQLIPTLTKMFDGLNNQKDIQAEANRLMEEGVVHSREQALVMAAANVEIRNHTEALTGNEMALHAEGEAMREASASAQEHAQSLADISAANEGFIGTLKSVGPALQTYNEGVADAKGQLADGQITLEEYSGKVRELGAAYAETKNQVILSIVEMKLAQDGWTDAELDAYLKVGKQLGIFDDQQIATAKGALQAADYYVRGASDTSYAFDHMGERALDSATKLAELKEKQMELGSGIRKDALPAAAALARTLGSLPPSGTEWDYAFNIVKNGSAPNLSNWRALGGAGNEGLHAGGGGMAAGGQLSGKWALVGDAPGGGLTPYSELISPSGYVFPADVTKKMFESGMIGNVKGMMFGGDLFGGGGGGGGGSVGGRRSSATTTSSSRSHRRASGSRMGSPAGGGGLNISASGGGLAEAAAVTATAVAQDATVVASQSLTAAQTVANNVQQGTQQTVSAQFQSSNSVVDAIERQTAVMNKVLTEIRGQKYSQQLSI